jgi:cytochrome P450
MRLPIAIESERRVVSLDPRDPSFFNDPYPAYAEIHAVAPVFFWEQYGFCCFARHADVSALLRDKRFGRQILHRASRKALGWSETPAHLRPFVDIERYSLLELEPPQHTRLRTLVNRAFVSRQIERLRPRIEALANQAIDGFVEGGEVDLLAAFATPIPVLVIAELLGVPNDAAPQLLGWSHRMVAMYQFNATREVEDLAVEATRDFVAFLRDIVQERRKNPADDLISQLVSAEQDGGKLSADELVSTCILILNAGHEATVHGIGNGVKAILEHRLNPSALFATPDTSSSLVDELLRYDAPLHLFTRYALKDCVVENVQLKTGDKVGLVLGAANRDPRQYSSPDLLIADRRPNPMVSFGGGIHFCLGAPLARLEMVTALSVLFDRLPNLSLAGKPQYRDSYHFRGLEKLPVEWTL